jgi:hypothetical protein
VRVRESVGGAAEGRDVRGIFLFESQPVVMKVACPAVQGRRFNGFVGACTRLLFRAATFSRGKWLAIIVGALVIGALLVPVANGERTGSRSSRAAIPMARNWVEATLTTRLNIHAAPSIQLKLGWVVGEPGHLYDRSFSGVGLFARVVSLSGAPGPTVPAHGGRGRYTATVRVPVGGIREVEIGIRGSSIGPAGTRPAPVLIPITNDPFKH